MNTNTQQQINEIDAQIARTAHPGDTDRLYRQRDKLVAKQNREQSTPEGLMSHRAKESTAPYPEIPDAYKMRNLLYRIGKTIMEHEVTNEGINWSLIKHDIDSLLYPTTPPVRILKLVTPMTTQPTQPDATRPAEMSKVAGLEHALSDMAKTHDKLEEERDKDYTFLEIRGQYKRERDQAREQVKALLTACRTTCGLARLKYGNLDKEVDQELIRVEKLIASVEAQQ